MNKAIQETYGNKIPDFKKNSPIRMAEDAGSSPIYKKETVTETKPKELETPKETSISLINLKKQIQEHKDYGNKEFKNKIPVMAVTHFTEAIKLYQNHKEMCESDEALLLLITQCYTNRALSWHQIDNQADCFSDADYVLRNLDTKNAKSLFRRAHCYKLKH